MGKSDGSPKVSGVIVSDGVRDGLNNGKFDVALDGLYERPIEFVG